MTVESLVVLVLVNYRSFSFKFQFSFTYCTKTTRWWTDRHTRMGRWRSLAPTVDRNGTACIVHSRHRRCCADSRTSPVHDRTHGPSPPPTRRRRAGPQGTETRARYTCTDRRPPRRPGRSERSPAAVRVVCGEPSDVWRHRSTPARSTSVGKRCECPSRWPSLVTPGWCRTPAPKDVPPAYWKPGDMNLKQPRRATQSTF